MRVGLFYFSFRLSCVRFGKSAFLFSHVSHIVIICSFGAELPICLSRCHSPTTFPLRLHKPGCLSVQLNGLISDVSGDPSPSATAVASRLHCDNPGRVIDAARVPANHFDKEALATGFSILGEYATSKTHRRITI